MIEFGSCRGVAQEPGELVEGSDLDRARAGKLLLHAGNRSRRQHPTVWPNDSFAVLAGRRLGINIEGKQAGNSWHGRGAVAQRDAEHFVQIGCRVRAHQEHPLAAVGQRDGGGAGQRGLSHAALAREEEVAGCFFKIVHRGIPVVVIRSNRSLRNTLLHGSAVAVAWTKKRCYDSCPPASEPQFP